VAGAWVYKKCRDRYDVMWRDADGRLRSKSHPNRGDADDYRRQKEIELAGGGVIRARWDDA